MCRTEPLFCDFCQDLEVPFASGLMEVKWPLIQFTFASRKHEPTNLQCPVGVEFIYMVMFVPEKEFSLKKLIRPALCGINI